MLIMSMFLPLIGNIENEVEDLEDRYRCLEIWTAGYMVRRSRTTSRMAMRGAVELWWLSLMLVGVLSTKKVWC